MFFTFVPNNTRDTECYALATDALYTFPSRAWILSVGVGVEKSSHIFLMCWESYAASAEIEPMPIASSRDTECYPSTRPKTCPSFFVYKRAVFPFGSPT